MDEYLLQVEEYYSKIFNYLEAMRFHYEDNILFMCGYGVVCFGFMLYSQITRHNVKCIIFVLTIMSNLSGKKKVKTDNLK